ncbi:LysR substrate-binding domain-containing protein [Bradyrhizobium betae]|uniref:LysR substrate-binding domain-containing protein n=1 Tax=Bradyrhizobium betae TaxID=244734 RepID=UPI003D66CD41
MNLASRISRRRRRKLFAQEAAPVTHTTRLRFASFADFPPRSSHPLAHSQRCSLQNLIDEPMALLDQPRTRDYFLSLFASKGLTPRISQRTDSFEMVRSLVANGFGHSLLTFVAPYHVVGHGKLSSRPLPGLKRSQNPVLGSLYRFRAPRLVDELNKSISAVVQMLHISAT